VRLGRTASASALAAGTLGALVSACRASSDYRNIPAKSTRVNRDRYLKMIEVDHGHRSVAGCRRSDIRRMRATDVRMLPIGEHEPWPADVLARALATASPMMRLAIVTGLCSGARIGDVICMQHGWHDGRIMELRAEKNKADVAIPMHPLWLAEIGKVPRTAVTLLYDRSGKPFSDAKIVQERLRRLMADIGSPTYVSNGQPRLYSFHGLRKNAACYLAKLRLNDTVIGSICGMTADTVQHYTKPASALMVARGAADRVTRGTCCPSKGDARMEARINATKSAW
jgi:integrase